MGVPRNNDLSEGFSCNISNTRDKVSSGYPNTERRVENTTRSGVFLTKFEVFGYPMKHCLECLIYLLNRNKNEGVNGEVKSSKSMLIKTGYPNLLHGCDFLCFNLMNYYLRSKLAKHAYLWMFFM